ILAVASAVAVSARRALAKTAAIATHPFGLATPRSVPPTNEKAFEASVCSDSGGAVAIRYASQRTYAAETQTSTEPIAGTARSAAVVPLATTTRTVVVPTMTPTRYRRERRTPWTEPAATRLTVAGPG